MMTNPPPGFRLALALVASSVHVAAWTAPEPTDPDGPWCVGPTLCRICGNRDVSVVPASRGLRDLECAKCGGMSCDGVEDE